MPKRSAENGMGCISLGQSILGVPASSMVEEVSSRDIRGPNDKPVSLKVWNGTQDLKLESRH